MATTMAHPKWALAVMIVLVGLLLGVIFQEELFAIYFSALAALALVVPFTFVVGLFALISVPTNQRIKNGLGLTLVIGCSIIVSLVVFCGTGWLINKWKIDAVESYVARAIPILDQIKQKEGSYPPKLPVQLLGKPPELLEKYGDYTASPLTFRFEYINEPAGWAGAEGAVEFDNINRKWTQDR